MTLERLQFLVSLQGGDATAREFEKVGKSAQKNLGQAEKSTSSLGSKLGGLRDLTVAGFGAEAIVHFGQALFNTGLELEAMNNKAEVVFGDQIGIVRRWADANAAAMGTTADRAVGLGANLADLLIPMKFTRQQATSMTTDVLNLAGALSAWSGGTRSVEDVMATVSKAMLGEREELKGLGISISEADVKARLLEKRQHKLTGTALEQAKALATLELVTLKSADAQAAWADGTQDSIKKANESKAAWKQGWDDLSTAAKPPLETLAEGLTVGAKAFFDFTAAGGSALEKLSNKFMDLGRSVGVIGAPRDEVAEMLGLVEDVAMSVSDGSGKLDQWTQAMLDGANATAEAAQAQRKMLPGAKEITKALDDQKRAFDALMGSIDKENAVYDLTGAFDDVEQAGLEAFAAVKEGTEDAYDKTRDHEGAVLDLKKQVAEYGQEVAKLPPEQVTEVLALIDEGKFNEAERRLKELERERNVRLTVDVQQRNVGAGGQNGGAYLTAGSASGSTADLLSRTMSSDSATRRATDANEALSASIAKLAELRGTTTGRGAKRAAALAAEQAAAEADLADKALAAAQAASAQAAAVAELGGAQLSGAKQAQVQLASLDAFIARVGKSSPAAKALQSYIAQLRGVAAATDVVQTSTEATGPTLEDQRRAFADLAEQTLELERARVAADNAAREYAAAQKLKAKDPAAYLDAENALIDAIRARAKAQADVAASRSLSNGKVMSDANRRAEEADALRALLAGVQGGGARDALTTYLDLLQQSTGTRPGARMAQGNLGGTATASSATGSGVVININVDDSTAGRRALDAINAELRRRGKAPL